LELGLHQSTIASIKAGHIDQATNVLATVKVLTAMDTLPQDIDFGTTFHFIQYTN
jgi:hypothetical protein